MNKLAGRKRLSLDYVGESYGVFATHLAEDNTNSSVRIESLYDSSHGVPASLPPFPDYIAYALHTIVERLCAVSCHMNAGVYLIKGGATEFSKSRKLFEQRLFAFSGGGRRCADRLQGLFLLRREPLLDLVAHLFGPPARFASLRVLAPGSSANLRRLAQTGIGYPHAP